MSAGAIALIVLAVFVLIVAMAGVRIVPQARAGVVERLGRYARTLDPGLTLIIPFIDRVKPLIDLREQVVTFPPQPVITEDNLVVGIDTVIYFTVTDPKTYTSPWTVRDTWALDPDTKLIEYACMENNRALFEGRIKPFIPPDDVD